MIIPSNRTNSRTPTVIAHLRGRDEKQRWGSIQGPQLNRLCRAGKIFFGPLV